MVNDVRYSGTQEAPSAVKKTYVGITNEDKMHKGVRRSFTKTHENILEVIQFIT
jgi:hypothetical protein